MSTNELLENRLQVLEARIHRLESTAAIERLQRIYGYYLDTWVSVVTFSAVALAAAATGARG